MKLSIVIFINLLITTVAILCADERCFQQNVHGFAVQIAHPTDCHKFFKCDESHNLREQNCPNGLEFNPYLEVCDYPNGFCMTNSTKPVQSIYNCSSSEDGFRIGNYYDNCRSYITCSGGISKLEICKGEQHYDSRTGECTPQLRDVKCEGNYISSLQIYKTLKKDQTTFYPNLNNFCRSYFKCDYQNNCQEIFCEYRKIFDTFSNTCESNPHNLCDTDVYKNTRQKRNAPRPQSCAETTKSRLQQTCFDGQYIPDDCYCRKFYLCVSGIWRLQTCSKNQYFNKTENYCVPDDGTCIDECDHGAYREDSRDCARYYLCIYGKWRLQECGIYQYFNKELNFCEPDKDNKCSTIKTTIKPDCHHGEYKEYDGDCTKFYLCLNGKWTIKECSINQYFSIKKNYCIPEDGTCRTSTTSTTTTTPKPECIHGEYKEDAADCTRFYLCVVDRWRIQTCSKNQYFEPSKNNCVPEDGTCRTTTPSTTTPKPECIHGQYKEHSTDCTSFYLCVIDRWRIQTCSENQYFDPITNYCVPEDGTCRTSTTSTTTTSTTTTPKPQCVHGEYKEYPGDCIKFQLCVFGKWRDQTCSEGQYFNRLKNYCIPEDGTCRTSTTSTTTTTPKPQCVHGQYQEHPTDCVKFLLCVLGHWREQYCSEGQYFNSEKNYCIPEDGSCRSTTTSTSTERPDCINGEYRPYDDDCTKFELCVLGRWRLHKCSPNQYFNKTKNYCIPEDGTCNPTTTTDSTTTTTTTEVTPTPKPECENGEFRHYDKDCTKFELCVLGYWRLHTCPENQYFNKHKNYCIPEDGTCRTTTSTSSTTTTTTTTTTEKPECNHGDFEEYPSDCERFWLCVNGKLLLQSCPEGQYYNKMKKHCIPEDGTCRTTTPSTSSSTTTTTTTTEKPECQTGQFEEYPQDCERFYLCVNGKWRLQSCPRGQYFNKTKKYCIPEDGTCRSTTSSTTSTTTTSTTTSTTPSTTTSTTTTTEKPECQHGEFEEYPQDCERFRLCVNGKWRLQTCPIGQYFNKTKNYCIPEDGSCRSTTSSTSSSTTTSTTTSTTPSTTTSTTTTTEKPECQHGEFEEYPQDCERFHLCVNGKWRLQSCPSGQYFNKTKNYCIPEDGSCRSTTSSTTSSTTTSTTTSTTPSTTTSTTTTTEKPECQHGEFEEYPQDCERFRLCVNGKWRLQSCPSGQYFNKTRNYCIPEDGTCRSTTSSTTSSTTTSTTTSTTPSTTTSTTTTTEKPECQHGEFEEYPQDCEMFRLCVNGKWRLQSCPSGQYFNKTKNYCIPEDGTCRSTTSSTTSSTTTSTTTSTTPSTTTSTTTTTEKPECQHGEFEEYPQDCERFRLCVNGKWRLQSCPSGQYFNKTKNYCIPEDGSCRSTTSSTTSSTTTSTTTSTTPSTTTSTTTTTEKPECQHGEFEEYPQDCEMFRLCVNGKWRLQSCPSGQYFNKTKNYCIPEDGSCRSTTSSTSSSTTTSTTTSTTPSTTTSTTTTTEKPECQHGEFEEYPQDCERFHLCVNGKWRLQSCPSGQYFNKTKNYCIPEDGSCRSTTSSTTSSTTTSTTTSTTPSTTTSTTTTTEKPECQHGEFEEYPQDCEMFRLCVNGKWRLQSCPSGQYFNKTKNYCIPEDGSCRSTTSSTTSSTTTSTTTSTTPSTTTSTTTTTEKPKCQHGEFEEYPQDCEMFRLCVNGKWRLQSCPSGQYFNKTKNYCIPEDGSCRSTTSSTTSSTTTSTTPSTTTSTTTTTTTSTTTTTEKPECQHGEFEEYPQDCERFHLCVNGKWRLQSCPSGQYFNKTKNYCIPEDGSCRSTTSSTTSSTTTSTTTSTTPSTTTSTTTTTEKPECQHGEFEEYPQDCEMFRLCVNGKWRLQTCPSGQYFNKTKNYCIPEDGSCRSTTSSTTSSTTTSTTTSTTPSTTTSTTTTTEKPECQHGEFEEYPQDCERFRLCVNGKWRLQSCPSGQYFNKTKNYCIPEDGSCRSTTSSSTSSTTTSTTPSTTTSTTPSTTTSTTTTTEKPECQHGEFEEYPQDCEMFRLCVNGKWRLQSCPSGQYFNKTKNYCIPEDGSCRSTTSSTSSSTTTSTTTSTTPSTTTSTTTTTEKPECQHGEFEEYPQDCEMFRLCVNGKWRLQSCPSGQYFNKTKNYCIPEDGTCRSTTSSSTSSTTTSTTPSTTTSTTPSTTTSTTTTTEKPECQHGEFEEYPQDCEMFRLCVNGKWRLQSCPSGQYFNKTKNYCIPEDGSCRSTTSSTTSSTTTSTTTTTTPSTTTSTSTTTEIPECVQGDFAKYPQDCEKFYLCVYGKWRLHSCPSGQYFNKEKKYCIPEDGTCRSTTSSTSSTTTTSTTTSTTPSTTTSSTTSTEKPECEHGEFEEYPQDCEKFYLCVNGKWRLQSCPNGQYFNKLKNYCIPEDGTCKSTTSSTSSSTTTSTTTSTTPSTTTTSTSTTTENPECQHGEFEEYLEDCEKFYLCVNGKWRLQSCPSGQYFNKTKNYCIPEDGSCRSTTSSTTSSTTTSTTTSTTPSTTTSTTTSTEKPECQHGEFEEYSEDCEKFYLCVNGMWRLQSCPSGQYFNKTKNYCIPEDGTCRSTTSTTSSSTSTSTTTTTTPSTTTTSTTTTEKPQCRHGEFKEYPEDCEKFYLCVNGKWRLQSCPNGQYFNKLKNYCIPEDGSCKSTTSSTSSSTRTTTTTSSTPSTTTTSTTTTTEIPECQHGEFEEYPEDCEKFYLCVNGKWRLQSCPNGQYFNRLKNYCIPEDGTCKSTTPSTSSSTTTSTTTSTTHSTTTTTTEAPECQHGEFEEYPQDCEKFYLCVSGKWRLQSCPNGQYFNRLKNYCIPEDGTCKSTTSSTSSSTTTSTTTSTTPSTTTTTTEAPDCQHGEFEEYPQDCEKFYLCVNGKWRLQSCPNGQYFNKIKNYCIPEDGTCKSTTSSTSSSTTSTPKTSTSSTTTTTTEKPECQHGLFEKYPNDCEKFYVCVNGKWRLQSCPRGQYFNEVRNYCIPEDGTCKSTTHWSSSTTTSTPIPSTTSTTTEKPECPHGKFEGHPSDCERFYLCVNGHWRLQVCPNGQYFNKVKNYCIPEDGTCKSTTRWTSCTTTSTPIPPTTSTTTEKPECPHGKFEGHPSDCERFYLCVNGQWRLQVCPNGQYFNKAKNYCIPEDGTCKSTTRWTSSTTTSSPIPPTTSTTTEKPECPHGKFEGHPSDCERFYLCVNGQWRLQVCPNGQYFNKAKNYCIPEDGTCKSTTRWTSSTTTSTPIPSTTSTTTQQPGCVHGKFEGHPSDCERFYLCVNGQWRLQVCPNGQYFNKAKNYCIPEDGTCKSTTRWTSSTTTSTPIPSTTSTTTQQPGCVHGKFEGHPSDCERFYLCVNGQWRLQVCPYGQYFNKVKNYCIPEDGTCKSTTRWTSSTTTSTPTPSTTSTTTQQPGCVHGKFEGHPSDCERFYLCVNGQWRLQVCPNGQYFNKAKNYCIPEDGTCKSTTRWTSSTTTSTPIPSTTSTTTQQPECPHGKFEGHPSDCERFYLCVNGQWRLQVCPNGQYFNKAKNYCIPEDGTCKSTTRWTSSTTTSTPIPSTTSTTTQQPGCVHGKFEGHPSDCERFYLCVNGQWRLQVCPNGQYFNKAKNYCIPEDGTCKSTTRWTSSTTTSTPIPSTTSTTTQQPGCVHGKFEGHPSDCERFYLCVNGQWRLQVCPNGQYFNKAKNYCIPEDGTCKSTTRWTSSTTTSTLIPSTTSTTTQQPGCVHGKFEGHPSDCERFYLCVNGQWRLQVCPNGQYFNKAKNYCIPEDGTCKSTTRWTSSSTTSTPIPSTASTTTEKPGCPHGKFDEHVGDCTKFELCVHGNWKVQSCPPGQYFNKLMQHCIIDDGSCITTTTTTSEKPSPNCVHGQYREDPNSCFNFYLCILKDWKHEICPEGQYFSREKNFCVLNDGSCNRCIHGEYKEHEFNCSKFNLCVRGIWRSQNCLPGQYFNKEANHCIPNDGSCSNGKFGVF